MLIYNKFLTELQKSHNIKFYFDNNMSRFEVEYKDITFYLCPNMNFPFAKKFIEIKKSSCNMKAKFYFDDNIICNITDNFIKTILDRLDIFLLK